MFYATTIKKVTTNGVEDIHGKILRFTGSLPWKEGDTVWTDGKFILGHVPIRGGAILPPEESGIPVVADKINGNSNITRGYFKLSGNFKHEQIAEGSWVTNEAEMYRHGDRENVFDAEISDNRTLYTIESTSDCGIYHLSGGNELSAGEIVIKEYSNAGSSEIGTIQLSDYTNASDKIGEIHQEILSQATGISCYGLDVTTQLVGAKIDTNGNTTAIIGTRAFGRIDYPMKLVSHGTYNKAEFQAETFLWESSDTLLTRDTNLKDALIAFWEYCCGGEIDNYEVWSWQYDQTATETNISRDIANVEAQYLLKKNSDSDEIATLFEKFVTPPIYSDFVNIHEHDWYDVDAELYFSIYLNNSEASPSDEEWDPQKWDFQEHSTGLYNIQAVALDSNNRVYIPPFLDISAVGWVALLPELSKYIVRTNKPANLPDSIAQNYLIEKNYPFYREVPQPVMTYKTYPISKDLTLGYEMRYYRFFVYESDLPIQRVFSQDEVHYFLFTDQTGKEHSVWLLCEDESNTRKRNFCYETDSPVESTTIVDDFDFPVQDKYYAKWKISDIGNFDAKLSVTSIFNPDDEQICGEIPDCKDFKECAVPEGGFCVSMPNISITPLRDNRYLLGMHGDKIYTLANDRFEEVGDGMKNFRLRKMKNINKAKK